MMSSKGSLSNIREGIVCPVTVCDELNVCDEDTDDNEKSSDTLSDNRCRSTRSNVEEDVVMDSIQLIKLIKDVNDFDESASSYS